MTGIIYKHTNTINNKSYIGFTKNTLDFRLNEHINDARNNSDRVFHKAIRKYGIDIFTSEILETLINTTKNIICDREIFWIAFYNTHYKTGFGYNMTDGGEGGNTGGMKPETIVRKNITGNDGLNEFQRSSLKGVQTKRKRGTDIIGVQKTKLKMLEINEYGLNKYQQSSEKFKITWKSKSQTEKNKRNSKIAETWKNKSTEELCEWSKLRSKCAKSQIENESIKTKDKRKKALSEANIETVSSYNLKTKVNKRVSNLEWSLNPLLGGITYYITKVTYKNREHYLFNPNSYKRFANDYKCSLNWARSKLSNNKPFTTNKSSLKHLEGIIRERVLINDLTDDEVEKIILLNYI